MSEHPVPEYRVMLATDIEDYSSRNDAEQRALQKALAEALNGAADAAELKREEWLVQAGGDSVFAILPNGTDLGRLMDRFIRELDAGLGSYNRRRAGESWTRMRLRLAVHAGPVHTDGQTGWPGQHAVLPVRLRDSAPVRAALGALRGADLAVIISADVYRDYITQGPGNPRPSEFRTLLAQGQDRVRTGHLLVPGFDVHAIRTLDKYDVPDAAPAETPLSRADRGSGPAPVSPADGRRPAPWRSSPVKAGGDVVFGDMNTVSGGGSIYRAGHDITLSQDHQPGTGDE
jgi:hypothetical protein